jgi:phosphopentomutase
MKIVPFPRVTWIVLDSVGAGAMPDAETLAAIL